MTRAVAARERAIGALLAVRSFLDEHPDPATHEPELGKLFEPAALALRAYVGASGQAMPALDPRDIAGSVERLLDFTGGNGVGGPLAGMSAPPYPGSGGVNPTGPRSWGLGAGVVSAIEQRGIRYGAELVSSANVPVVVPIRREPVADFRAARFVADIIPEEEAIGGRFAYWRQTVRTNNAAAVAAGARKPTSVYTGVKVSDEVVTVAHLSEPVNRFDLEDAAMLRQFLTDELEYGLRLALDEEILNGDGTGASMTGIVDGATAEVWGGSLLATTRNAVTSLEELDVTPSHFVLPPAAWQAIEEEAASTFAALPAMSPLDSIQRRLHGFPVVVSNAVTAGTGILGDFRNYAVLYRTGPIRVDWTEAMYRTAAEMGDGSPGTDFARNMLTFRAELRANIAVLKPSAFLALDLLEAS